MTGDLRDAVWALRQDPARTVLLFDFDGTLAPLVDDPAAAAPAPGVVERLEALALSYQRVGVVSGRPLTFLSQRLPASLDLSGLYGLESRIDGLARDHPEAPRWRPVVASVARAAVEAAQPGGPAEGVLVEAKGLSLTLHVRTRPDLAPAAADLAARLAGPSGLDVRSAKMSVELHPPIAADKGTAVRALAQGASAVLYVGDDVGDLPAFGMLDELRIDDRSIAVMGIVVGGPEMAATLVAPDRLVLADQASVLELLDALAV